MCVCMCLCAHASVPTHMYCMSAYMHIVSVPTNILHTCGWCFWMYVCYATYNLPVCLLVCMHAWVGVYMYVRVYDRMDGVVPTCMYVSCSPCPLSCWICSISRVRVGEDIFGEIHTGVYAQYRRHLPPVLFPWGMLFTAWCLPWRSLPYAYLTEYRA